MSRSASALRWQDLKSDPHPISPGRIRGEIKRGVILSARLNAGYSSARSHRQDSVLRASARFVLLAAGFLRALLLRT